VEKEPFPNLGPGPQKKRVLRIHPREGVPPVWAPQRGNSNPPLIKEKSPGISFSPKEGAPKKKYKGTLKCPKIMKVF